jgi:hypothetical protein
VWLAVSRRRLIGPIFCDGTINEQRYRKKLFNVAVPLAKKCFKIFLKTNEDLVLTCGVAFLEID